MKRTILIVDSVDEVREELKKIFQEDYTVLEAKSGEQVISYIEEFKSHLALIIMEFDLPRKSGLEVVKYMVEEKYLEKIPVVMITDEEENTREEKAVELGVSEFIYKPFHRAVITRRCANIVGLYKDKLDTETEVMKYNSKLNEKYEELSKEFSILSENSRFMIDALSSAVEFRKMGVGVHVKRIRKVTDIILHRIMELYPKYGLTEESVKKMVEASVMHDIGKVEIPREILFKPGKLTAEEFVEMKNHTLYGCHMLEQFKDGDKEFYGYCYDICKYHHERADGAGYPEGLKGEEIPIWAQAVSIADVFDALLSHRVYKEAYELNMAIAMIYNGECGTFSEEIMAAFTSKDQEILATIDSIE